MPDSVDGMSERAPCSTLKLKPAVLVHISPYDDKIVQYCNECNNDVTGAIRYEVSRFGELRSFWQSISGVCLTYSRCSSDLMHSQVVGYSHTREQPNYRAQPNPINPA